MLVEIGSTPLSQKMKLATLLRRPKVDLQRLRQCIPQLDAFLNQLKEEYVQAAEIKMKYAGYIEREKLMAEKLQRLENVRIPPHIDYHSIHGLSAEAVEKLSTMRPQSIGQASRISGVSPSDVSVLLVYLGR